MISPATLHKDALHAVLNRVGAPADSVVWLHSGEAINARNYEYADLLNSARAAEIAAVVEKDGSPLLYLACGATIGEPGRQRELATLLANRAETALLLTLPHGEPNAPSQITNVQVWHCSLTQPHSRQIDLSDAQAAAQILGDLQSGMWADPEYRHQEQRLRDLLVSGVHQVADRLRALTGENKEQQGDSQEVLALVGRALFTRFLLDRSILSHRTAPRLWQLLGGDGSAAFADVKSAAATCGWLDATFNGEFMQLPLGRRSYQQYFAALVGRAPEVLAPLGWIMNRTDAGGQLNWDNLDFSHIPVGTLSEVYEKYAHHATPEVARQTSVHFTPRHVARMMVRQSFAGLEPLRAPEARVLDPAVGAAVFLGLSFRELARQHALAHGTWPDTVKLRSILYDQLRGMDINAAALNLAALTLYLTAIELDANPLPPEKLRFERPLMGTVLFDVLDSKERLGSLSEASPAGTGYDLVIANPPWTSDSRGPIDANAMTKATDRLVREIASERTPDIPLTYAHPDNVPDLAFAWRAMRWARADGIIAMVMSHRLLGMQSSSWTKARRALFSCLEVSGIVNAGEFSDNIELIWPGINVPFCVLFAKNRAPKPDHVVTVLTPEVDPALHARRHLRLDPQATVRLGIKDFEATPNTLNVLIKGSELDLMFLRKWFMRLDANDRDAIDERDLPMRTLAQCLAPIQLHAPARGMKKGGERVKLASPAWYSGLARDTQELATRSYRGIESASAAVRFTPVPVRSSPDLHYFAARQSLLIREAPGAVDEPARAFLLCPQNPYPVVYSFSYLGVPLAETQESLRQAKYICLWVNSDLFAYFQVFNSSRFTSRRVIDNRDILEFPMVPYEAAKRMNPALDDHVDELFESWGRGAMGAAAALNHWVFTMAGFTSAERQLVADTLSISYPIGEARTQRGQWVSSALVASFASRLQTELADVAPEMIELQSVAPVAVHASLGWRFVCWRFAAPVSRNRVAKLKDLSQDSLLALVRNTYPMGQVWAVTEDGWGVFGQLALQRHWLASRAPLHAATIVAWADHRD